MEIKYYSNPKKGCTACKISCREGEFIGKSKCCPDDKYDVEVGSEIAYKRALLKLKKEDLKELIYELNKAEAIVEKRKGNIVKIVETMDNIQREIADLCN